MKHDLDELSRLNNAGDRYGHITPGVVAELIAEVRRLRAELNSFVTACGEMNAEVVGLREENSALHELHTGLTQACLREQEWQKKKDQYLDEIEADAERYHWVRGKMGFTEAPGKPVVMSLCGSIPAPNHNMNTDWVGDRFDASVDEAIDAARAKEPK